MASTRGTAGMRSAAEASLSFGDRAVSTPRRLWLFAYEDGDRAYLPRVRDDADRRDVLPDDVWLEKRRLITDLYGFRRRQLGSTDHSARRRVLVL